MKILGVDPGIERTGWSIINTLTKQLELNGLITTSKNDEISFRLYELQNQIERLIIEHNIKILAIEKIYSHKKILMNLDKILQARGVILSMAGKYSLEVQEFTPTQIKKALTGSGKATKEDIIRTVYKIYHIKNDTYTDDVYDAIAIGLTCFHTCF